MRKKTVAGMFAAGLCAALLLVAGWDGAGEKVGETQAKIENTANEAKANTVEKTRDVRDAVNNKTDEMKNGYNRGYSKEKMQENRDRSAMDKMKDGYNRGYDKEKMNNTSSTNNQK